VICTLHKNPADKTEPVAANAYIPLGCSIPALQRLNLAQQCYKVGFENVYQGDTDSFMTQNIKGVEFGQNLGDWNLEGIYLIFIGLVAKRYAGIMIDVKYLMKTDVKDINIKKLLYAHYVMAGFKLPEDEISVYDIDDENFRFMVKTARLLVNGYEVIDVEKATKLNEIATNYQMSRKIVREHIPITRGYFKVLNDIKEQLQESVYGRKVYEKLVDLARIKGFAEKFQLRVNELADASKEYARLRRDYERIDKEINYD
jgi:hypothetical protein